MKFKSKSSDPAEVDMTPMIDIVFQLIAFFMVITNFEQTQADERVKLPKDALAKPPKVKPEEELVINFGYLRDVDGKKTDPQPWIFYPGQNYRISGYREKIKQEARLAQKGAENMTVTIRADGEVPTGMVQELMKMSQEAGFVKFKFKATQSSD